MSKPDGRDGSEHIGVLRRNRRNFRYPSFSPATSASTAEEALKRIGELYAIEETIRGLPATERLAARQSQSKPLLRGLPLRDPQKTQ
ncbi:hypothetical protein A8C67_14595 [Escherichia coli]|jgi:hypothetical protein|nr:hypothetical protein EL79_5324 [Escherichia coli]OWD32273.1 hypothetical protein A8C67_14595 [Escherichia coli]HAH2834955.1 hypothetical protein [Escherichia coli]